MTVAKEVAVQNDSKDIFKDHQLIKIYVAQQSRGGPLKYAAVREIASDRYIAFNSPALCLRDFIDSDTNFDKLY